MFPLLYEFPIQKLLAIAELILNTNYLYSSFMVSPRERLVNLSLSSFFAALTAIFAQLKFNLGPVPYTMQNFAIILAAIILEPKYAAISQLIYLLTIASGVPAAAGFRGGVAVLIGYTAGYLWMFPVACFLMSYLSRQYARFSGASLMDPKPRDKVALLLISLVATIPMYMAGFLVFYYYTLQPTDLGRGLKAWSTGVAEILGLNNTYTLQVAFIASVAIFVPQDLFVDHLLAIIVAPRILKYLKEQGVNL